MWGDCGTVHESCVEIIIDCVNIIDLSGGNFMKHIIALCVLFPAVVFAQGRPDVPPNMPMDSEQMRRMEQMQRKMQQMDMGKMQEAMACMQTIDRSAMERLKQETEKVRAELVTLCRSGNRDEAQEKAKVYAHDLMARSEMQKMKECGKLAAGMFPKMPFQDFEERSKTQHVCDDFGR